MKSPKSGLTVLIVYYYADYMYTYMLFAMRSQFGINNTDLFIFFVLRVNSFKTFT